MSQPKSQIERGREQRAQMKERLRVERVKEKEGRRLSHTAIDNAVSVRDRL